MQLRKVIFELDLKNLNENLPDCEGKDTHARERDPQVPGHRVMEEPSVRYFQRIVGTSVLVHWRLRTKDEARNIGSIL